VTFHAGLSNPSPEGAKNIKARVLVLQGANDPYAKPADVDKFEDEMRATKVDWQFRILRRRGAWVQQSKEP
jgi:dienelactone hydrolase